MNKVYKVVWHEKYSREVKADSKEDAIDIVMANTSDVYYDETIFTDVEEL